MCFCAKAAFSTVQIQKNLHPYFHWLLGQKNTTLPLIMYITIHSFPLLSRLPPILAAQRPHLRATAPSGSSPASRGPLYPIPDGGVVLSRRWHVLPRRRCLLQSRGHGSNGAAGDRHSLPRSPPSSFAAGERGYPWPATLANCSGRRPQPQQQVRTNQAQIRHRRAALLRHRGSRSPAAPSSPI